MRQQQQQCGLSKAAADEAAGAADEAAAAADEAAAGVVWTSAWTLARSRVDHRRIVIPVARWQ